MGIGTTNPNYKLDVSGGASWSGAEIGVGQSTQAEGNTLINSGTYNTGRSYFRSTWDDNFRISTYDSTPNGNWEIGIGDGTGGLSAGKYIMMNNAGYLGIGEVNPNYKLDVNGQVRSTSGFVFPDGTTQVTALVKSPAVYLCPSAQLHCSGSGFTIGNCAGQLTTSSTCQAALMGEVVSVCINQTYSCSFVGYLTQ